MNDHGLTCVVVRSDGQRERSLHVNDVHKIKAKVKVKRKQVSTEVRTRKKARVQKRRYCKYNNLTEVEKAALDGLNLVGNYTKSLFDRRMYLDDSCALASLKLLRSKFPSVGGFQSVLLGYKPGQRDRNWHVSAEVFHCMGSAHYVCAAMLSVDVVAYMDSLHPGSKPPKNVISQIESSFRLSKKYCIRSLACQPQIASDCLVCAVANLDVILSGNDVSITCFNMKQLRSCLV